MKKVLLIIVLGFVALRLNAQDDDKMKIKDKDVPQAVRAAFDAKFDKVIMVEWKEKDGKYKAMFRQGLKKHMAEFSSSGEMLAQGEKINKEELPTPVADAVKVGYASSNIDEVYRIEKDGQTQYAVKLEGNPKKKIVYDAQGKVIREK